MTKKPRIEQGWDKEYIKYRIRIQYGTIRALAKQSGVIPEYLTDTLLRPRPKGEGIIARALGVSPAEIWPERYTEAVMRNHRHWRRHDNLNIANSNASDGDDAVNR
jgi:Ner family transcriptional regulator